MHGSLPLVLALPCLTLFLSPVQSVVNASLTWIAASDTHLGHDVGHGSNFTTAYTKNVWAISDMNALPGQQWPPTLGGGVIAEPVGVTISGDLLDGGLNPSSDYDGCAQWVNFTALYGFNGSDGLLRFRSYEGRGVSKM